MQPGDLVCLSSPCHVFKENDGIHLRWMGHPDFENFLGLVLRVNDGVIDVFVDRYVYQVNVENLKRVNA